MDQDKIKAINKEVYRRFPEVKGKKPKVQVLKLSNKRGPDQAKTYLLVYGSQVSTSNQQVLPRIVRVVATEEGVIVKITTSK
ncbi:MAG: hypothetical protein A2Z16_04305 [Chloroflexi bacterium RBG_16_54_18]|nr:MAG: hypothetical protein A2Z16_04305 [Chloroflexi bacterium RBG_16_54_18]